MPNGHTSKASPDEPRWFATTHWSVVLAASRDSSADAQEPLEKLCRTYWPPLYAFVRRQGHDEQDAQDLTQEFFARLLGKKSLRSVNPDKGKFRSFLLASMKHFLANEWDRKNRLKRGGGTVTISLDDESAESSYLAATAHELTPEKVYDRRWAQTVVEQVLTRLRREFGTGEKASRFEALKGCLLVEPDAVSYAELAGKLQLTEAGVRSAVFRLRHRFREVFRNEIAHTVATVEDIDEEIRHLLAALGS